MDFKRIRGAICKPLYGYFPAVYRAAKSHRLSDPQVQLDEANVINFHENSVLLHITSLLLLVPSIAYYSSFITKKRQLFADTRPTMLRLLFWTSSAFNAFMGCIYYDKWHQPIEEEKRLKDKYRAWIKQQQLDRAINGPK